jgi:hypothetical protein
MRVQIRQKNNRILFNQQYSLIQGYAEQYQEDDTHIFHFLLNG